MNKFKETGYDAIDESLEVEENITPEVAPSLKETARAVPHLVKCALAATALFGCFLALSRASTPSAVAGANADLRLSNTGANLELPSYLSALDESHPEWDKYSSQLTSRWVIGNPGGGNLVPGQVEIVEFVEPHFVFRTYGGDHKASQCGYWWTMTPPSGAKDTYFDHFAICPEWNDASDIIRCRVPVGYIAAVGVGQTVDCPESGGHLAPDPWNLQLNGDICSASIKMEKHLSCEYCSSNVFDLEKSACSNEGPNYLDGFTFKGN